jgi:lysophospholipase L1-like esterase
MTRRLRNAVASVVTAASLLVGLGLAAIAGPASATANPPTTLLVLGDSLTWGTNYFAKSQARLAAANNFDVVLVDSRWGRRISGLTSTRYSGNAALKQLIADGVRPTAVIVALGTNDVAIFTKRREYSTLIQELMTTIGNVPVAWVNVHRIDSASTIRGSKRFNAALGQALANYPLASVFDWAVVAKSNPKVIDPDKIHLTPLGHEVRTKAYLEIAATLAQRASDMTTTTTSTTTSSIVPSTTTTVAP